MDPNYIFSDGNRPLHHAASLGLIEVVVWLVKVGALSLLTCFASQSHATI